MNAPPTAPAHRSSSLRRRLLALVLAPLLPLALATVALSWQSWHGQRDRIEETLLDTAVAVSLAVDRDVSIVRGQLDALAASRLIDDEDWRELHRYIRTVAGQRDGAVLALVDRDGWVLVLSNADFARDLPNLWSLEQRGETIDWHGHRLPLSSQGLSRRVFETGAPVVSRVFVSLVSRTPTIAVAVPVTRDGAIRHVLVYSFPAVALQPTLDTRAGSSLRLLLVDREGVVIAGSRTAGDELAGTTLDAATIAAVRAAGPRFVEDVAADGEALLSAYAPSAATGWTVKASQPRDEALAPAWRSAYTWGGLFLVVLGIAVVATISLARRLSAPLVELAESARSPDGVARDRGRSGIREIDVLRERLARAAATELERRAELERRVASEERERVTAVAAASLRARERELRVALDAGSMGTWHLDTATQTVRTDRRLRMLWGIDGDDDVPIDAHWLRRRIHPEDRARLDEARQRPGAWDVEFRVRADDGGWRWLAGYGTLIRDESGRDTAMVGVNFDVTDRRRAEDALREDDRRKDEFIAVLAHELRNPLAPLRNGLRVLGREAASARAHAMLELCERQVHKLARLIDDLLDVARIKQGRIDLRVERLDLQPAVRAIADAMAPTFEARGLSLRVEMPDAPIRLDADPVRLAQCVENLLSNAAKFTDRGGTVTVRVDADALEARIAVTDTGVGLAGEDIGRVFDLFSQVDATVERTRDGLGIGLALVRQLVELHGGRVAARSAGPGRGSTFELVLPRAGTEAAPRAAADREAAAS